MQADILPLMPLSSDLEGLVKKTRAYIRKSKSANTIRGYRSDWADFVSWTAAHQLSALPATPVTIALYLSAQSATKSAATLARRLNSLAFYHRAAGNVDSPTHALLVRETFKGIRREIGTAQKFKQRLLSPDIRQMVACCPETLAGLRDRALCLCSYAMAARRSEAAALRVEDVAKVPEGIVVTIRRSKVDPEAVGRTVGIPYGVDEATCPVRALYLYLDAAQIRSGAIFRGIDQKQRVSPVSLHRDSLGYIIKRCVARAGLKGVKIEDVAGHSLRAGAITQAARNGVPEFLIRRQSGHKPGSRTFDRYIRLGEMFTLNAASGLGL